jgi:putative copper export protein
VLTLLTILHFLGASFLIGGEPLVAIMAIKAEKDDTALKFFAGFVKNITIFMWVGMVLALIGGIGMMLLGGYMITTLFWVKMGIYALIMIVSFILLIQVPKVQRIAQSNFMGLRTDPTFKRLDILSKIDMILVLAILIVSVIMVNA